MHFKAMGNDKKAEGEDMVLTLEDETIEVGSDRHTDLFIETPLGPDALAKKLLGLFHAARTAEEEQGLNILFLAMGFLNWRESASSEMTREAPLILIPVELVRNDRSSTFDIRVRDEDITTNLPLQERLQQDFGISLPEIDEQDGWSPTNYISEVEEAVSGKKDWSVDRDGMQVGFFSFAKLLMHRDLDPANWPGGTLADSGLISGLLVDGFESEEPLFGPDDKLDALLDPAEIIQVIDADASQTKVIEEVRRGASLVVQGPPGTGKSQTITNIIAAAAHDGKSVLFVAEKMAALSVVHQRLVKAGLRDICLELHSRSANKKALAHELGRTLTESARAVSPVADAKRLREARDELNEITALLHEPSRDSGMTPFRAMSEIISFIGQEAKPPSIPTTGLEKLTREQRDSGLAAIGRFVEALSDAGDPQEHPFRGTTALDLQPTDLDRLQNELFLAEEAVTALINGGAEVATTLDLPSPTSFADFDKLQVAISRLSSAPEGASEKTPILYEYAEQTRMFEALQAGKKWGEAYQNAASQFTSSAWEVELGEIRIGIARGQGGFLSRLFGPYRRASTEFSTILTGASPKAPAARLALVDQLEEVQRLRKELNDEEPWLKLALGGEWRGERTPFGLLQLIVKWLAEIKSANALWSTEQIVSALQNLPDPDQTSAHLGLLAKEMKAKTTASIDRLGLDFEQAGLSKSFEDLPLAKLRVVFEEMRARREKYSEWAELSGAIQKLNDIDAGYIVEAVREKRVEPSKASIEFAYACAEANWNAARREHPELNDLARLDRHELVSVFRDLEKARIDTAKNLVLSRHFEQMPRGTMGEMGIIRGEIGRKRGHKPIRWIMKNAGNMVQRIKPVMLMSPISVAQFLPAGTVEFDLLVIDEASQIRPEDALGVIARAKQIVVVGDQKQLPPTSFFDRLVNDSEDDEDEENGMPLGASAADMESILSLCDTRGLRSRMLEWHYRSRDPSLIRVSNAEFYNDQLVLPPSPLQLDDNYGLKFRRVPGVYARGGSGLGRQGTNRIEAEIVAKAVGQHARDWPDLSLGIVTFSKNQADMMTEIMELERRKDPILDAFLREGRQEDVFVKNIENVQGDERDVILISVGYGPQEPNGRLASMSFGPINSEGGERRLNVLFSRARVRCEVFASFDPGDIDPSRTARDGPRVLKRFLDFAKTKVMEERRVTGLEADSPFEEDVAKVICDLGYLADPQVGTAGFRIDIGVRHPDRPGQYLVAVECDGAAYHSALWARERDRLRQDILEGLGWEFHRIWSTDWFHNRDREIERLREALSSAKELSVHGVSVRGANGDSVPTDATEVPMSKDVTIDITHLAMIAPPYQRAEITLHSRVEPHEAPVGQLADLIEKIVQIEGPIHTDELARRVSTAFGKSRTGGRIVQATGKATQHAMRIGKNIKTSGQFVMTAEQIETPPVRDRSQENTGVLKAIYLPPTEIRAAADSIQQESGELEREEMIRAVARLLGFQRVGPDLFEVIGKEI